MLGIRTGPEGPIISEQEPWRSHASDNARHGDNWRYATIGYQHLRKILRVVSPGPKDVFYDIGCGMGRILCVAAQQPVRKCAGVELQITLLCQIARRNAASLRGRKAPIEIVCGVSERTVDLSDGTNSISCSILSGPKRCVTRSRTFEDHSRKIRVTSKSSTTTRNTNP